MRAMEKRLAMVIATALSLLAAACGQAEGEGDLLKRGEYLVAVAACGECHTPGVLLGRPDMARVYGGSDIAFHIPELGYFYPPNLTPDGETGLGNWSREEIAAAIRTGTRPDGRILAPVMPYGWYAKLTQEDAMAMAAYLKSLAPIANKVPGPFGPEEKPAGPYSTVVFPSKPQPVPTEGSPEP